MIARRDSMLPVVVAIPDSLLKRQVAAVFGDSAATAGRLERPARGRRGTSTSEAMRHRRVEFYVHAFTGSAGGGSSRASRGSLGDDSRKAPRRQHPEDMYYLALVESGFEQHAYSRAAAVE